MNPPRRDLSRQQRRRLIARLLLNVEEQARALRAEFGYETADTDLPTVVRVTNQEAMLADFDQEVSDLHDETRRYFAQLRDDRRRSTR